MLAYSTQAATLSPKVWGSLSLVTVTYISILFVILRCFLWRCLCLRDLLLTILWFIPMPIIHVSSSMLKFIPYCLVLLEPLVLLSLLSDPMSPSLSLLGIDNEGHSVKVFMHTTSYTCCLRFSLIRKQVRVGWNQTNSQFLYEPMVMECKNSFCLTPYNLFTTCGVYSAGFKASMYLSKPFC